ncbi:MAG: retroviral-like aspartic protease family protein [Planctomycetota bacterium]|nr:retroviral-like aspartic protease family protein [Planctomycetota bacterium]
MGEVRAMVVLTNAADLAMMRRKLLKPSKVRKLEVDALVDTGAVALVVPSAVAQRLGLARPFTHMAEYADGRREEVGVTEAVLVEIAGRQTQDEALVLGDEVIIGQTVLEKTDLHVDCTGRRLIPNPAHPDQPVVKIK